jgi:hypothetical protein
MARSGNSGGDRYVSIIGGGGFTISTTETSGELMISRNAGIIMTSLTSAGNQYAGPVWISLVFDGSPPTAGSAIAFDNFLLEAGLCPDIADGPDNPGAALCLPESPITVWTDAIDNWNCDVAFNILHGEYLAVWQNSRATRTDIYARRIDGEGNPLSWFSVVSADGATNWQPSVAFSSAQDAYLVAYTSEVAPGNWDIYARRIGWNGSWMSSEFPVVTAVDRQDYHSMAYNSQDDEFLVVYRNSWAGGLTDIAAQRVRASDGSLLSWRNLASLPGTDLMVPDVAYNPVSNNYLVVFGQEIACVGEAMGLLVSANMSTVSPLIPICTNSADQHSLAVATGPEDFLVVWEESPATGSGVTSAHARRIAFDGTPLGEPDGFPVSPAGGDTYGVSLAFTGDRGYLVAWTAREEDGYSQEDVYACFVPAGYDAAWGGPFRISGGNASQRMPALAAAPWGTCLLVQECEQSGMSASDIHARLIVPLWLHFTGLSVTGPGNAPVAEWEHFGCGWAYTVEMVNQLEDLWTTAPGIWPVYQPPYIDLSAVESGVGTRFYKLNAHWQPPDR